MPLMRAARRLIVPSVIKALTLLLGAPAIAQDAPIDSQPDSPTVEELTTEANEARQTRSTRAMGVLLGWSALNVGVGTVGYFTTDGSTRYFHQMNAAWNLVNAAIAGIGLTRSRSTDPAQFTPLETVEEDYRLQKVLLFNMGLNVAYMAGGAYLWERGLRTDDERLRGYGPSIVAQGGFLLLFDSTFFWLQNRSASDYRRQLSLHWQDGPGLSVYGRF